MKDLIKDNGGTKGIESQVERRETALAVATLLYM